MCMCVHVYVASDNICLTYVCVGIFHYSHTHDDNGVAANMDAMHVRLQKQQGIIRVNCVDCLDRTNVCIFVIAKSALTLMLYSLGVSESVDDAVASEMIEVLQMLFTKHGDRIAHQYAGSGNV